MALRVFDGNLLWSKPSSAETSLTAISSFLRFHCTKYSTLLDLLVSFPEYPIISTRVITLDIMFSCHFPLFHG
jgi:hypothetical protein